MAVQMVVDAGGGVLTPLIVQALLAACEKHPGRFTYALHVPMAIVAVVLLAGTWFYRPGRTLGARHATDTTRRGALFSAEWFRGCFPGGQLDACC